MKSSDRKSHWEATYKDKSPLQVSWYQVEPTLSLQLIQASGVQMADPIIDVGGGASTLVDHLLQRGYQNLSVLDIAETALAHAKTRLGERAQAVKWIVSDITQFKATTHYAVWHDRAVFHFLTDSADRQRYVENLQSAMQPGGHVIIAAFALDGPVQCSGLDIVRYDAAAIRKELGDHFRLLEELPESHLTPAGKTQQFNYYHFRYL